MLASWPICRAADSAPTFFLSDFSNEGAVHLVGAASHAGKVLRLTPSLEFRAGAAWAPDKQTVQSGFETTFQFQLTAQGGLGRGADGFAFVLQNSGSSAVAGRGASGGFAVGDGIGDPRRPGIPNSIAVFFDTYRNEGDPSANYVAICTNGSIGQMQWPPPRLAFTHKLKARLKDGRVHTVHLEYKPPVLSVFLDHAAAPVLFSSVDLATVVDSEGKAYAGFTASTGAGYENHDILSWSFSAGFKPDVSSSISFMNAACLPDKNLCTPDRAVADETGPARYHVVLPANLQWGASIPNPSDQPISITNARGTICWDLKARGPEGCSGPAVNISAGSQSNAQPGALIGRYDRGRTYFSIHDPGGNFEDNEGFIEFDVEIR